MKRYGVYFLFLGLFILGMAFARAKSEREVFLILATIPTAFLAVRFAGMFRKQNRG